MSAIIEPFFLCLLASMIWAPIIFLGARYLANRQEQRTGTSSLGSTIWPAALILAALPALLAPIAASLGVSLRAPAALPVMSEFAGTSVSTTESRELILAPVATTVSIADILKMMAVLYFYGFMMVFALAALRHVWFSYRLKFAADIDEPELKTALENWRLKIGVSRQPRYVFSHIVSSVCVYGIFRPVIIMPYNLLDRLSIKDAALMGAHEMAHIKRGDVALFALCTVAKSVFWFNPFMHRICAQANLAAEQGADALVLSAGVNRHHYANCFVQGLRLAAGKHSGFAGELIPSFTPFDKRSRRARLDAILSGAPSQRLLSTPSKIALSLSAVFAVAVAAAQATIAVPPRPAGATLFVMPVDGEITSQFTADLTQDRDRKAHTGIDIRAKHGSPVLAAGDGKVIDATESYKGGKAWGKVVVIDHGHGLLTRYAHLGSYAVDKGESVDAGDVIAKVGATGKADKPHLHFEIIENGETINPAGVFAQIIQQPISTAPPTNLPRAVPVVPALSPAAPLPPKTPDYPEAEKKARKVNEQLAKIERKMRNQFHDFEAFENFQEIEIPIEAFDGFSETTARLQEQRLRFKEQAREKFESRRAELSEVRRQQERARKHAEREFERAEEKFSQIVVDLDTDLFKNEFIQEKELLDIREKAIKDAKADLENELREIKRRRQELKAQEKQ
ncbi:peptidoglycan DD-metalloendopeptidase family protein [Hyphococcus sp. DH-69]|uniref:M23/M56 family metallopeptidase n=1 Tax=Hyphococcus formosus TaxID=3143534 RepID=UPI00398A64DB